MEIIKYFVKDINDGNLIQNPLLVQEREYYHFWYDVLSNYPEY